MKKYTFLLLMLSTSIAGLHSTVTEAQITVNIGAQPNWGPVGYDRVDYYYLPGIDTYYNVPKRKFIYLDGRNWVSRSSLPVRNRRYDLYHGYKVVVNEPRPYLRNEIHKNMYAHYQGVSNQPFIRDNRNGNKFKVKGNIGNGNKGKGHGYKGGGKQGKGKKGGHKD